MRLERLRRRRGRRLVAGASELSGVSSPPSPPSSGASLDTAGGVTSVPGCLSALFSFMFLPTMRHSATTSSTIITACTTVFT